MIRLTRDFLSSVKSISYMCDIIIILEIYRLFGYNNERLLATCMYSFGSALHRAPQNNKKRAHKRYEDTSILDARCYIYIPRVYGTIRLNKNL